MGTFNIISSTLNSNYEYKDTSLVVNGSYTKDAQTDTLQNVSGSCYRVNGDGEQGDYVGNFNGYMRDGEVRYSLSEMSRRDSNKTWDAIDEIELNIIGTNAGEE